LKTQTKPDGRLRQVCAAAVGRPTRRSVPAICKGGIRKGPGRMCHHSCIRGRSKASPVGKRGMAKSNVERGTPEGRTDEKRRRMRPECDSGIRRLNKTSGNGVRGRIMKRDQRLVTKRTHHEATRQDKRLEIVKIAANLSIRLWELGDRTLWKGRPPPKRKR
jgi:hypothetical protein